MKKIVILTVLMTFQLSHLCAQVSQEEFLALQKIVNSLQKDQDSLQVNYSEVENGRKDLEQKLFKIYKSSFDDMELSVWEAFDKTDVISATARYQEVIKSIISLHNEITTVNNFVDAQKVFGFDFIGQINSIAEEELVNQMVKINENEPKEVLAKRRMKFKSIINNVLNNPVISGFIKSNPITSVAHSIINQTMSAQFTQIKDVTIARGNYQMPENFKEFKKGFQDFKSSYETSSLVGLPETKRVILDESVNNFTKKLEPLIKLFDDLSDINKNYESGLKVFMKASEHTISRAKPIEMKFYQKMKTDNRIDARTKINHFFNIGPMPSLDLLEDKLNNAEMKELLVYSDEVREVNILLKNDFLKILSLEIELSKEYIEFFQGLKTGKKGLPNFDNTDAIDHKIKQFEVIKQNLESQVQELNKGRV